MRALILALLLLVLPAAASGQTNEGYVPKSDPQQVLKPLQNGDMPTDALRGYAYIPDPKARNLVLPGNRAWRDFKIGPERWIIGGFVVVALIAIVLIAIVRGDTRVAPDPQGRRLLRFDAFERLNHWMTAVSFVILALTGLNLVFGRLIILPWMGDDAFAAMTHWGKVLHNFVSFPFMLGILVMLFLWARANLWTRVDSEWVRRGGGLFGGEEPPAGKFNAGQKGVFWVQILGGIVMAVTGLLLLFPFYLADVEGQQWIQIIHAVIAAPVIAVIIGHIYLGTAGTRGSFEAMAEGSVDLNWARKHHPLWAEQALADSREAPSRGAIAD
jgi:formate dehydrogenase subunit gamma